HYTNQCYARGHTDTHPAEALPAASKAGEIGPHQPHHGAAPGRPSPAGTLTGKNPDSMRMSLASVDFLEWRKKRPYKPIVPRPLSTRAGLATDDGRCFR